MTRGLGDLLTRAYVRARTGFSHRTGRQRRSSVGLSVLRRASVLGAGALCAVATLSIVRVPVAVARWGHGCTQEDHCYAVTTWPVSDGLDISNTYSYITTNKMSVRNPASNFVDNEQWTSWESEDGDVWVEAGQEAGNHVDQPSTLYPFWAMRSTVDDELERPKNDKKFFYHEVTGTSAVEKDHRNLYQFVLTEFFETPVVCIKWLGELWPSGTGEVATCQQLPYAEEGKKLVERGPEELEAGIEAADIEEPESEEITEGYAVGAEREVWEGAALIVTEPKEGIAHCTEYLCTAKDSLPGGSGLLCAGKDVTSCKEVRGAETDAVRIRCGASKNRCRRRIRHAAPIGRRAFASDLAHSAAVVSTSSAAQIGEREGAVEGDTEPTAVEVAKGTLEAALEVMSPGSMTLPSETANAGERADLENPVYVVELHGAFTMHNAKVPPGVSAPEGTVLRVVIDAETGQIEGRFLEYETSKPLSELGAVTEEG